VIMTSTYDFAEPGFILIDRANEMNNNWWCENIRATNPCVTADTRLVQLQIGFVRGAASEPAGKAHIAITFVRSARCIVRTGQSADERSVVRPRESIGNDHRRAGAMLERERGQATHERARCQAKS